MDFKSSIDSCESAISTLKNFAATADPLSASVYIESLSSTMPKCWPKLPKGRPKMLMNNDPQEAKDLYQEWITKYRTVLDMAQVATSKIQDEDATDYFSQLQDSFATEVKSTQPATPAEPDLRVGTTKVLADIPDLEFTTVQYKGKEKAKTREQRSQVTHRFVFSPTPSIDLGTDLHVEPSPELEDMAFPCREVNWGLAYQKAQYGYINAEGKRVSKAKASPSEAKTLKPIQTSPEVYYDLHCAEKELILVLRQSQLMCVAHLKSIYLTLSSENRTTVTDDECELTSEEASQLYGEDEMQCAQVSYWAAQAEAALKDHHMESKNKIIQELYVRLAELPARFDRGEAARRWTRFLIADLMKGTSPNKSIATMRHSIFSSWRPGESKAAYIKRVSKTTAAVWGNQGKDVVSSFEKLTDFDVKPVKKTRIAMLREQLAKQSPSPRKVVSAIASTSKSYAAAAASSVKKDFTEAKAAVPELGLGTWFRSWFSTKMTVSVENLKAAKRTIADKNLFSRFWSSVVSIGSSVLTKTIDITPRKVRGARIIARLPRFTWLWAKAKAINTIRWFGKQLFEESGLPFDSPSTTVLFDSEAEYEPITLGASTST